MNGDFLVLQDEPFELPAEFGSIDQINPEISGILKSDHFYDIRSNISKIVLQEFVDFWVKNKPPSIYKSKIDEYFQLSKEFQYSPFDNILNDISKNKPKQSKIRKFIPLNTFLDADSKTKSQMIREIASQFDDYIFLYGNKLFDIPIKILYKIISHPDLKLTKQNLFFEKAYAQYKKNYNSDYLSLIPFLDGQKLNSENLETSFSFDKKSYMPKMDKIWFLNQEENSETKSDSKSDNYKKMCDFMLQKSNFFGIDDRDSILEAIEEGDNDLFSLIFGEKTPENPGIVYKIDPITKTAGVFSYNGENENVFIPSFITYKSEKYIITSILNGAFKNTQKIATVYVNKDSELRTIGKDAFNSSSLRYIYVPPKVTRI